MKKKFSRVIAHHLPQCLLLFSILTSNVLFPASVIAQEIENTNNIPQEETVPIDTSEDILEEGISTSIYEEEEVVEPLFVFENGIYTVKNVIQDEEYKYPDNNDVRVKFTEVTQEGNLVIKRVELTEEQKELLNTKDSYGWNITSSMSNGTFKYNLTLPNTQGNEDIEVKYTEDGNEYESIDNSNVEIKSNVVTIEGLDHFTVFVVTGGNDSTGSCTGVTLVPTTSGDKCYLTIQAAINNANNGDTINVASGTYTEDLDITESITLKSINGYANTIIKGSIQISSNNVTIDGLTIDNNNQMDGRAIAPKGSKGTTITNNKITNAYRGIQGDYYGRPTDLTITNNIFENISYGIAGTEDITNLLITGNTFKTSQEGIGLGAGMTFPTGKTIDNLLTDNTFNLTGGYAVGDYRSGSLKPVKYTADGSLLVEEGDSIQAAINAASVGDTIKVAPGTYTENITINKRLKIEGSGSGDTTNDTIITSSLASTPVVTITTSGTSDSERLVLSNIRIEGTGNSSDGIYILGSGSYTTFSKVASVNNGRHGVHVPGSYDVGYEFIITDCVFSNNGSIGFRTGSAAKISGLTFTDTQADYNKVAGLYFTGPLTGLNISGGSFDYNYGSSDRTSGVGIYAGYENGIGGINQGFTEAYKPNLIKDISVSGNSRGIILNIFGGSSYLFENIIASNNNNSSATNPDLGQGITIGSRDNIVEEIKFSKITAENNSNANLWFITYDSSSASNLSIQNSTLTGSTLMNKGYGLRLYTIGESTLSNVSVTGSTITGNNIGIYLNAGSSDATLSNISIEKNSIGNNGTGILISNNISSGNSAHKNNIAGNTTAGIQNNDTDTVFDATLNWWGASDGPSSVGSGTGDTVSSNVSYREWLCEPYETGWNSINGSCAIREIGFGYGSGINGVDSNPGMCDVYTNDISLPGNKASQILQFHTLEGAEYYMIQGYKWNGSKWVESGSPYNPGNYTSGFSIDEENNVAIYKTGATNEGIYTYEVNAYSTNDGLIGQSNPIEPTNFDEACKFTVDRTPPDAPQLISPEEPFYTRGVYFEQKWEIIEDAVKYEYNSCHNDPDEEDDFCNPKYKETFTGKNNTTKIVSAGQPDSHFWWRVRAQDLAGNWSEWSEAWEVIIDNTSPAIPTATLTANGVSVSTNGYTSSKTFTFNLSSSEDTTRYQLKYWNDISTSRFKENSPWNPTNLSGYSTGLGVYNDQFTQGEGKHYFSFSACDATNNCSAYSDPFVVTYDKTPPSVPALESPIGGAYIKDNTPLMQWANSSDDYSGVKGYYYRVFRNCPDISDSSTCSGVYPDLTGLWRTNSEYQAGSTSDGTYYWQVMAEDNAGNKSNWSNLEKVTIDIKAPDAPKITFPTAGSYFTSTPISNQWTTVTDSSGIAYYRVEYVYDDKHPFSDMPYRTTTSTQRNHTPGTWEQGGVTIRVQAVDNAGNEGAWSDPIHYTYDETRPTIEISSPAIDESYQNESFNIVVNASDTNSELNNVVVHIYDKSNSIVENCDVFNLGGISTHTVTCNINTIEHSDGIYTIETYAYDLAGNMSQTLSRSFTIDTTAPEVKVTSHNDGDFVNGTVTITGEISDINLSHYWFVVVDSNGTQVAGPGTVPSNDENITTSFIWDTTNNVTDGEYIIKLEARDLAENKDPNEAPVLKDPEKEGDSVDWVTITVDNTPPKVLFANQEVPEILTELPSSLITSKSEDLLGDPECAIDEGITFPIDAESENNQFTVSCTYSDLAGNENTSTYTVTVTDVPVKFTLSATKTEITQGDDDIALGTNITNGNSPYTYLWSEDCTGTGSTTTFSGNSDPGDYTCTVTVTDADGDTATDSIDITVGAVAGATTGPTPTKTNVSTYALGTGSGKDTLEQGEEILETTSIEEPSVLGERCENKKKVSGYVYIDKNKDKEMNENEEGIKDITLTIQYTDEEGNIKTEEEVNTDEKGYWETQLCSGKYNIVVKEETLPKNIEVAEVLSLTVPDNEEETIFDIQALDTRNFWQKYWYLIVGGLAIIAIGYISLKNRKKEEI